LLRRTFVGGLISTGACTWVARGASLIALTPIQMRVKAQLDLNLANELNVGAVMMAVQHDKVLVLEAAGYLDGATKVPMPTDAIFDIRSISKPITVFAALQLVDTGKLALDDPISRFLPEFTYQTVKGEEHPAKAAITIRQLMMHTSGVSNQRPIELEDITRTFDRTLAQDVALVAQQPLDFTPGTRWAYSSSGIAVLGRIIEVVSGEAFEKFVQESLFVPLDMEDSSFFTNPGKLSRIPTMYNLVDGRLVKDRMDVTRPHQKYSAPDFGMFSSAEDLRHFGQMMLNQGTWKGRRLLSDSLIAAMTTPVWQTAVPKYHGGLGWAIHTGGESQEMSYAVTDGSYGANGASGCIVWLDPSIQLIRIYLTHYFLGDFRDGNLVMNAAFPG
jgi:CubicO group peptidase (beta-lactamase class C family)